MSVDRRGRQAARVTRRLAERRGPVPPLALLRRRQRRRAWRRVVATVAVVVAVVVVSVRVLQHAGEGVARPPSLGRVAATIHVGGQLGVVHADAAGVWVEHPSDRSVVGVDPRTNRVVARVALGPAGSGLGAVGDGSLWLTHRRQGTLTRVEGATGRVVATIGVPGAGSAPEGMMVAVGAGAVWVAYRFGDQVVVRIDPATNRVAATIRLPNLPTGIAVGGRAVMVLTQESGVAYQIDPATNRVVASLPVCVEGNGLAYGRGAFWVGCGEGDLLRIDPVASRVVATVDLRAGAGDTVVDADGSAVWVATIGDTVIRVDQQTNAIVGGLSPTRRGSAVTGLATSPGAVWLTSDDGTLIRVDPNG
jgi:virginiamycin B lyase